MTLLGLKLPRQDIPKITLQKLWITRLLKPNIFFRFMDHCVSARGKKVEDSQKMEQSVRLYVVVMELFYWRAHFNILLSVFWHWGTFFLDLESLKKAEKGSYEEDGFINKLLLLLLPISAYLFSVLCVCVCVPWLQTAGNMRLVNESP